MDHHKIGIAIILLLALFLFIIKFLDFLCPKENNKDLKSLFFYRILNNKNRKQFLLNLFCVLFLPFLFLTFSYWFFRENPFQKIPRHLIYSIMISSIWLIGGPYLVYSCFRKFFELSDTLNSEKMKLWFQGNSQILYHKYIRYLKECSIIFIIIGIPFLILKPDVLIDTVHLTKGYNDCFYWLIILFLCWLLIYCANAFAFIRLIQYLCIQVRERDILKFSPIKKDDYLCIKKLIHFSNTVLLSTASGLLFLPIAIYFLYNQLYVVWVVILLFVYSIFLFCSTAFPRCILNKYIEEKQKLFTVNLQEKYFSELLDSSHKNSKKIVYQLHCYNLYFCIQESRQLKTLGIRDNLSSIVNYLLGFLALLPNLIPLIK